MSGRKISNTSHTSGAEPEEDVTFTEPDLALCNKDRLLQYEENILMMKEGVDLLRLKERQQTVRTHKIYLIISVKLF